MRSSRPIGIVLAIAFAVVVTVVVSRTAGGPDDSVRVPQATEPSDAAAEAIRVSASELAAPAHDVRAEALALREVTAEAIVGSDDDHEALSERVGFAADRARAAADALAAAGRSGPALQPTEAPAPTVEALAARVSELADDATDVAAQLHGTVDETEATARRALDLQRHASALVAATAELPDSDEPAAVADAWRAELDHLDEHRHAAETAAEDPALEELAAVHLDVIERLEATAEAALDHLDDDAVDAAAVDAYEAVREDQLASADELADELLAATQASLEAATADLDAVTERTLQLLTELNAVRRDVPSPSAGA